MSYIEKAKQNKINAEKAQLLDQMQRDMDTELAVRDAVAQKEADRARKLVSEFMPSRRDYERQATFDALDALEGKPASQSDYAIAARNWTPESNGNVLSSVTDYLRQLADANTSQNPLV